MTQSFLEQLTNAEGESQFVISVNLDIRGFSAWCRDPAQSALYLKKLYSRLYADYFSEASMVKPTGDGLMIVLVTSEAELKETAVKTVNDAMEIVEKFGVLTKAAKLINYDVPDQVGIGISRGSAVRLVADGETFDYSGRVLNVCSRLMDLARPAGVVLDQEFGSGLFPDELSKKFEEQHVYLKGVSPRDPVSINFWPDSIEIPPVNLKPLDEPSWAHVTHNCSFEVLKKLGSLGLPLSVRPLDPDSLDCRVRQVEKMENGENYLRFHSIPVTLVDLEGNPCASVDVNRLISVLEHRNIDPSSPLQIKVSYISA